MVEPALNETRDAPNECALQSARLLGRTVGADEGTEGDIEGDPVGASVLSQQPSYTSLSSGQQFPTTKDFLTHRGCAAHSRSCVGRRDGKGVGAADGARAAPPHCTQWVLLEVLHAFLLTHPGGLHAPGTRDGDPSVRAGRAASFWRAIAFAHACAICALLADWPWHVAVYWRATALAYAATGSEWRATLFQALR